MVTSHDDGFTDIFFSGTDSLHANIFVSPGYGFQILGATETDATLRIRRVGATIFEDYDFGAGFQTLHSATGASLAGPALISLFLLQEAGTSSAHQANFDNLTVTADSFLKAVPEPTSRVLAVFAAIALCVCRWPRRLDAAGDAGACRIFRSDA